MTNQEVENKEEREKAINFIHTYLHPTGDTDFDKKKLKYRDMAIKALSVDYEGMAEELSKFSGIGGLSKKGISEIIKKYVENKEE